MLWVEIIDQGGAVAEQHAENDILPYPYTFALKCSGCSTISQIGIVVLGTEVTKEKVTNRRMPNIVDEFGALFIAHVTAFASHSLLEIGGIRSIHQHVDIMIGFDDKMIGEREVMADVGSDITHVGGQTETHHLVAVTVFDEIPDIVGRVMWHGKGRHAELGTWDIEGRVAFDISTRGIG